MTLKKNIFIILILISVLFLSSISINPLSATTWQVKSTDGGEGMSNNAYIQKIINNKASKGDTILFKDKSYTHIHLTINKPLNIVSKSNTKIYTCPQETPTGSDEKVPFVVTSRGTGTTISGFNILNYQDNGYGVLVNGASNVKVQNNQIQAKKTGIKVIKSSGSILSYNTIKGATDGINVSNSKNIKISKNKIGKNIAGVELIGNNIVELSNNVISYNRIYGIKVQGSSSNKNILIKNNNINKNKDSSSKTLDAGICINGSYSNLKIYSNTITENGKYGILLTEIATKNTVPKIEYNYIANNRDLIGSTNYVDREIMWFANFETQARHPLKIGYNFYGKERNFVSLCASTNTGIILWDFKKTSTKGVYQLYYKKVDENGNNKGIAKYMNPHKLKVYLNHGTSSQVAKTVVVKNGIANIDLRKAKFKASGNKLYSYNIVEKTLSIKNSEIPKNK